MKNRARGAQAGLGQGLILYRLLALQFPCVGIIVFASAIADHRTAIHGGRTDLGIATSDLQRAAIVIPVAQSGIANVALTDEPAVTQHGDFQRRMKWFWNRDNDATILRFGIEAGAIPIVGQRDGKAAIPDAGFHVAIAILDADSAVLGFDIDLSTATVKRNAAVLGVRGDVGNNFLQ